MRPLRAVPMVAPAQGLALALALALAPVLAGCSLGGGSDEPQPVKGAPRQVATVVSELDTATRKGDYRRICDDLFTASARRRAGGKDCASLLRSTARELRNPSIELVSIRVNPRQAVARVRTRATGQAPIVDQLMLRRVGGGYRIEALG